MHTMYFSKPLSLCLDVDVHCVLKGEMYSACSSCLQVGASLSKAPVQETCPLSHAVLASPTTAAASDGQTS